MLLNLLVIHLAFGSPFGVYRITRGDRVRSARSVASAGAWFVLWPIFAAAFVRKWVTRADNTSAIYLEQQLSDIRSELETLAFDRDSTTAIFEFRDIFNRYAGLSTATASNGGVGSTKNLFNVVDHQNIKVAAACVDRRNQERLSFHLNKARKEFIHLVLDLGLSHAHGTEVISLGKQVAELLADRYAADGLQSGVSTRDCREEIRRVKT